MILFRLTTPRSGRLRSTLAFTLIEVLWAAVLIATGVTATIKTVNGAKRSGLSSQRTTEASKIAAAELESLKSYSYRSLGMTGNVTGSTVKPTGECSRFNSGAVGSYSPCPTGSTVATALAIKVGQNSGGTPVKEQLVEPQNGGIEGDATTSGSPGLVPTTAKSISVGGDSASTRFLVFRYVTWHDEVCDLYGDNTLVTEDDCAGQRNTKTLVVGVEPRDAAGNAINPGEPGPNSVIWVSAVVSDPSEGAPGGGCSNAACGTTSRLFQQKFYLYDTPCNENTRKNQTTSHATRFTTAQSVTGWATGSKNVSACKNTAPPSGSLCRFQADDPWTTGSGNTEGPTNNASRCIPDLMGAEPPPAAAETADPADPFRYSADLFASAPASGVASQSNWPQRWGYGPAGILMQRTAGCPAAAPPTNGTSVLDTSPVNAASIHTWATPEFAASQFTGSSQKGFYVSGRMALNFYVGAYDPNPPGPPSQSPTGKGKLCITLIDRDEGDYGNGTFANADPWHSDRIIYQFGCEIKQVPLGVGPRWTAAQARSNAIVDKRYPKRLPVRRSCRFQPGYGQLNWAQNYVTATKSQIFPPPKVDPGPPNANFGAPPCQKTSGGGPGIIDYDNDDYDDFGYLVCNGHRLLLRVSVIAPDGTALGTNGAVNNMALYFDHEKAASSISITTIRKTELKKSVE